ncbi:hypothetical protein [Parvibium lacunae]|uniref:Uncharacterized protein n=1 Tax=Parvibium lacunae TaxID=1888893 RepID=A0A368L509_9BURK|nr:hypothetical protein [Parvibium lacunae]RCS58657.1 hypothetical protein DU000_07620 [Parvibium lacunae]
MSISAFMIGIAALATFYWALRYGWRWWRQRPPATPPLAAPPVSVSATAFGAHAAEPSLVATPSHGLASPPARVAPPLPTVDHLSFFRREPPPTP